MKYLALFLLIFSLLGCQERNYVAEHKINISVTVEGDAVDWELTFNDEPTKSCYLSGDVRSGTSQNIETKEIMSMSYVSIDEKLIIESPSGLCDAGVETTLIKLNGLYSGDLYSRSFFGHEKIGTVRQFK